jgi:putative zinc finger protein
MQPEMSQENPSQPCVEFDPTLVLLAAGELDPADQADVASHLADCARCTRALEQQQEMLALLAEHRVEPDATLLSSCRSALQDALDREEERGSLRRLIGAILPSGWLAPRPAWSAAILLLVGFSVGMLAPRLLRHPVAASPSSTATTSSNTAENPAEPTSPSIDLHSAQVAGINVLPTGENEPPQVVVRLRAQLPVKVQGTVNNDDVKSLLINVLRNNERFDPDDRLIAVDLLRARNNDSEVRSALCYAVHADHNAAVRLKALEALNGAEPQDIIRQTLLDALVDDQNPGVRVEAINALRGMAAKGQVVSDDHMLAVLHERMKKDPNTYIRIQSAAAIRDLGPREKF